jgi:hypothetical protein
MQNNKKKGEKMNVYIWTFIIMIAFVVLIWICGTEK